MVDDKVRRPPEVLGKEPLEFTVTAKTSKAISIPIASGKLLDFVSLQNSDMNSGAVRAYMSLNWRTAPSITASIHIVSGWLRRPRGAVDGSHNNELTSDRTYSIPQNQNANIGIEVTNQSSIDARLTLNYGVTE